MNGDEFIFALLMLLMLMGVSIFIFQPIVGSKKLFYSILIKLLISSVAIIFIFSTFYFMIFVLDVQNLQEKLNQSQVRLSELPNIIGLKSNTLTSNRSIFWDLVGLSSSAYFHYSSEIQLLGYGKIFISLENFCGLFLPFAIIILSVKKEIDKNKDESDMLQIYLNRGWSILIVSESSMLKEYQNIEIISPNHETKPLLLKRSTKNLELIRGFSIDWKSASLEMIPYFCKVLEQYLFERKSDLSREAAIFYYKRREIGDPYYRKFYEFLLNPEVKMTTYGDFYDGVIRFLKLLEEKYQNSDFADQQPTDNEENAHE